MRNKLKRTGCGMAAMLLAMGLAPVAHAQSDPDLTSKLLIAILVKKGVLSQTDANSILQEAQAAASAAQAAAPPPAQAAAAAAATQIAPAPGGAPTSTVMVSSTQTPDGTIHVTYIPQVVRDQIATAVTQQITAKQQSQGYTGFSQVPDWVNRIHFYGDFRARYEDDLFPSGNNPQITSFNAINTGNPFDVSGENPDFEPRIDSTEDRNRFEIRARLGADADLGDGFKIGIRLATGQTDSPVSENQTIGNANNGQGGDFAKYAIWLDRAYLAYTPQTNPDLNLTFEIGRFDNPFFSTNLIWADDLGFDGAAILARYNLNDSLTPFFTAGAFPIENTAFNSASTLAAQGLPSRDKYMFAVQAGANVKINQDYAAEFGIADYAFTNMAGKLSQPCTVLSASDVCSTDQDRPSFAQNGNTYMALRDLVPQFNSQNEQIDEYQYFGLASNFNELAFDGEFDVKNFDPTDIWLIAEYVRNLAYNKADIASKAVNNRGDTSSTDTLGSFDGGNNGIYGNVNIGTRQLTQLWDWNAMVGYKYIESDSVVDAFNDSDFGLGGTNLKGYIVGGNLALSSDVWVRLRYMSADSIAGAPYKSDVFQLDLNGKF